MLRAPKSCQRTFSECLEEIEIDQTKNITANNYFMINTKTINEEDGHQSNQVTLREFIQDLTSIQ